MRRMIPGQGRSWVPQAPTALDCDGRPIRKQDLVEHVAAPGTHGEVVELISGREVRLRWYGVDWDVTDAANLRVVPPGDGAA